MSFWSDAWKWARGSSVSSTLAKTALIGYGVKLLSDNINESNLGKNDTVDPGVRLQLEPDTENKIPVLYGTAYFAGDITDANLSADYKTMTYCLALCETTGTRLSGGSSSYTFNDVYLNNNRVVFKGDGVTVDYTVDRAGNQDISFRDLVKIYFYANGSGIQPEGFVGTTPASHTVMPGWTAQTHPMTGLAYAIVKVTYNRDKGVTALPECIFQITNSMTLVGDVLYDYMSSTRYGARIDVSEIDTASLTALNTFCSTGFSYTTAAGQTANSSITINGIVDTNTVVLDNMEEMAKAAGSWLTYDIHTGKWRVIINRPGSAIASMNDSNIIGEISISGTSLTQLNNVADVKYLNNDILDKPDFVKITLPEADLFDNEPRSSLQLTLPFTNKQAVALKIGAQLLKQARVDKIIRFSTDYSYVNLTAGDLISVTSSVYGFNNKVFRIITSEEQQNDDGAIQISFTALEYDAGVYQFAVSEFEVETNDGIIQIGSIGVPGTPQVTKIEQDSRPRISISSLSPSGVVEGVEFWLTNDTTVVEANRTYRLIATRRPAAGNLYTEDTDVIAEYDGLSSSDFFVKTRGFNSQVFGPFSEPSGLIEYRPVQTTDAIGPDTSTIGLLSAITLVDLLGKLDGLFAGNGSQGGMFRKIFDIFKNETGTDLIQEYGGTDGSPPTFTLTASSNTVNEGSSVIINLVTTNVIDGKKIPYAITGISTSDIGGSSLTGNFTVINNQASIVINVSSDQVIENETMTITLSGVSPATSVSVTIVDGAPSTNYSLQRSSSTVVEGQQFIILLNTNNVSNGTNVPYTITGVTSADISGAPLTGNFNVNNNTASITFVASNDGILEGSELFTLTLNGINPTVSTSVTIADSVSPTNGFLVISQRLPPDRSTYLDPLSGATSDTATINGSYFYKFSGWNFTGSAQQTVNQLRGAPQKGSGEIKLYKSDGTLVQTLTASNLIINGNVVEFPFAPRELGTDYYILIDQGVIQYCGYPNQAITLPNVWNFNTPLYSKIPYSLNPDNFNVVPVNVVDYSPNTQTSCPGNLRLIFNEAVSKGSGNVYIKRSSDDTTILTISASSGTPLGNIIDYGPIPDSVFNIDSYITADQGIAIASCYLQPSTAITKANNLRFRVVQIKLIDFEVDSNPFPDNKTKVNPQTNIVLVFNTSISFGQSGNFKIFKSNGSLHQEIDILTTFTANKTSELIWIQDNKLYLNPTKDLDKGATYYVQATAGTLVDSCSQSWVGISNTSTVRFVVDAGPQSTLTIGTRT